jgi:hypothetical protein
VLTCDLNNFFIIFQNNKILIFIIKKNWIDNLSVLWGALNLTWIEFNIYSYWYSKCERETYRQQFYITQTTLESKSPWGSFLKFLLSFLCSNLQAFKRFTKYIFFYVKLGYQLLQKIRSNGANQWAKKLSKICINQAFAWLKVIVIVN